MRGENDTSDTDPGHSGERGGPPVSAVAPVALAHPLSPEDRARADFYALLARLYADAPDARFLQTVGRAATLEGHTPFPGAWNRLVAASAAMDAEAAAQEYTDLFIGVGKCEVNLHASHWISGFMLEKPLADLRSDLSHLGLARRDDVVMLEDHLSALCETMRLLIAGQAERGPASVASQRDLFERHIAPWVFRCCTAIRECAIANYYARVAEFTEQYMALDRDALAMD